jgi:hypothetical protein
MDMGAPPRAALHTDAPHPPHPHIRVRAECVCFFVFFCCCLPCGFSELSHLVAWTAAIWHFRSPSHCHLTTNMATESRKDW